MSLFFASSLLIFFVFSKSKLSFETTRVELNLAEGSSLKTILKQLRELKVLTPFQAILFEAWVRLQGIDKKIQAGDYQFSKDITPNALLQKWLKGDVVLYAVTIPEGITLRTLDIILSHHPKIKKTPFALEQSQEGFYYPDTYYFSANTPADTILKKASAAMQKKLEKAWEERDPAIVLNKPYEALILASIIEKETANDQEKPMISGVFQRRLKKKIRLQADPTVIYGLGVAFNGNLTKENLKNSTPYNTYVHTGLPPTPIAMPGIQSIEAALHPDKTDFLYFVSKNDGNHHFSKTLQEHNKAVKKYQKEK